METSVVKIPPRIFRSCESGRTTAHDDDDEDDDDDDDDDDGSKAKGDCKKEKCVRYVLSMFDGTFSCESYESCEVMIVTSEANFLEHIVVAAGLIV